MDDQLSSATGDILLNSWKKSLGERRDRRQELVVGSGDIHSTEGSEDGGGGLMLRSGLCLYREMRDIGHGKV